jgi:SAM-dependent methyltransferase
MRNLDFDAQVEAWSRPPVDDVGYVSSEGLLTMSDDALLAMAARMRKARYGGWRNEGGLWRSYLGLDENGTDKVALDFGCGVGMESVELARAGFQVAVADIAIDNVRLATLMLRLHGFHPWSWYLVTGDPPYVAAHRAAYDMIVCSGVLHHIPWARQVMERFKTMLKPGGTVRLMVYSDLGWWHAVGTPPPEDVTADPGFETFVRAYDDVGDYADWYSESKLTEKFGDLFTVEDVAYIPPDDRYLLAVLRRRRLM